MTRVLKSMLAFAVALAFAFPASAQVFFSNTRVNTLVQAHDSVGTTSQLAIATASVSSNLLGWKICADTGNANYLAVGKASDADTDGRRLGAGKCMECPNCNSATLKAARVKGGAASQGYAVVQYKP